MCFSWLFSHQSAYLCLEPFSSKIYMSRHVKFVENIFPFSSLHSHLPRPSSNTLSSSPRPPTPSTPAMELPSCADSDSTMPLTLITPGPTQLLSTISLILDQAHNPPNFVPNP